MTAQTLAKVSLVFDHQSLEFVLAAIRRALTPYAIRPAEKVHPRSSTSTAIKFNSLTKTEQLKL
jgi:hypothetical protein